MADDKVNDFTPYMDIYKPLRQVAPPDDLPLAIAVMILLRNHNYSISEYKVLHYLLAPFYAEADAKARESAEADARTKIKSYISDNGLLITKYCKYDKLLLGGDKIDEKPPVSVSDNKKVYINIKNNCRELNWSDLIKYVETLWGNEEGAELPAKDASLDDILSPEGIYGILKVLQEHGKLYLKPAVCWTIAQRFITKKTPEGSEERNMIRFYTDPASIFAQKERLITEIPDVKLAGEAEPTGDFYISGVSLTDIFTHTAPDDLYALIESRLRNDVIKHLYVFIPSYTIRGIPNAVRDATTDTISQILSLARNIHTQTRKEISVTIVLLYDLNVPFCMINDREMLYRDVFLPTASGSMDGVFALYTPDDPQYTGRKNYLDLLIRSSYERTGFDDIPEIKKALTDSSNPAYARIMIKTCHSAVLTNYSKTSFGERGMRSEESVDPGRLFGDSTQKVLLDYLDGTSRLMNKVVRKFDPDGWATITPCYDLGFPRSTLSLRGGFAAGALYEWNCIAPLVFVDALATPEATSVFSITTKEWNEIAIDHTDVSEQRDLIEEILLEAADRGLSVSLRTESNYLCFACDEKENHYLILHCSHGGGRSDAFSLDPAENPWFGEGIHIEEENGRFIRYIRGQNAIRFYDYAKQHEKAIDDIHRFIFDKLTDPVTKKNSKRQMFITRHHNGMPTASSINSGCYLSDKYPKTQSDLIFPVIYDVEEEIVLFRRAKTPPERTHMLSGTQREVSLIPNLFGCAIDDLRSIGINGETRDIELKVGETQVSVGGEDDVPILDALEDAHIRNAGSFGYYIKGAVEKGYTKGDVYKVLTPVFVYDRNGCGDPFRKYDAKKWISFVPDDDMVTVGGG